MHRVRSTSGGRWVSIVAIVIEALGVLIALLFGLMGLKSCNDEAVAPSPAVPSATGPNDLRVPPAPSSTATSGLSRRGTGDTHKPADRTRNVPDSDRGPLSVHVEGNARGVELHVGKCSSPCVLKGKVKINEPQISIEVPLPHRNGAPYGK